MKVMLAMLLALTLAAPVVAADKTKVILDTDIADDVDDAYALALVCSLPNADLLGCTTAHGDTPARARVAAKLLRVMGRGDVPVCAGRKGDQAIGRQGEWAATFRSPAIRTTPAVDFLKRQIDRYPGQVTLVTIGALTNAADLIEKYPATARKLRAICMMGGAAYVGYSEAPPVDIEWNIRCNIPAAQSVWRSGIPIIMAGLDVTTMMKLDAEMQKRLFAAGTPTTDALAALTNLWGNSIPTLFDPVAVAWALGHHFSDSEERRIEVTDDGKTAIVEGAPNTTVLVRPRRAEFMEWYVKTVMAGPVNRGR